MELGTKGEYAVDDGDFAEIGPEECRPLRRELRAFYPREAHGRPKDPAVTNSFECFQDEVIARHRLRTTER